MKKEKKSGIIPYVAYLIWVLSVFIYYFLNNPWRAGGAVKALLSFLLILLSALGAGRRAAGFFRLKTSTFLEEFAVTSSLGLGFLYITGMILGGLGLLRSDAVFASLGLVLAFSARSLYGWVRDTAFKFRRYSHNRFSVLGAVFLIILSAGVAAAFITALSPPLTDYQLSVSLAAASRYSYSGLSAASGIYELNLPQGMFILYALGYLVYGVSAARLITFILLLILACGVYSMTRKFFHRKIALFAVTAALSAPALIKFYLMDHPAIASCLYSFMAFYAYVCWAGGAARAERSSGRWLIISGIFAGLSLSFGYYSMFTVLVLLIMVFIRAVRRGLPEGPEAVSSLAAFIIPFIIVMLPMLLRNYFISGDPLFPFFINSEWYEGIAAYSRGIRGSIRPIWHIPFEDSAGPGNLYYLGPVFPVLLPGLFLVKEVGRTIRVFFTYVILYLIFYFVAGRDAAMLYPLIPFLSIISAYIAVNLFGQRKYLYHFTVGTFMLALAVNFYLVWPLLNSAPGAGPVAGQVSEDEFLKANLDVYPVFRYLNENTPGNAVILFSGEERTLYVKREVLATGKFSRDRLSRYIEKGGGVSGALDLLAEDRVTHIVFKRKPAEAYKDTALRISPHEYTQELLGRLSEVFTHASYSVYEIL